MDAVPAKTVAEVVCLGLGDGRAWVTEEALYVVYAADEPAEALLFDRSGRIRRSLVNRVAKKTAIPVRFFWNPHDCGEMQMAGKTN